MRRSWKIALTTVGVLVIVNYAHTMLSHFRVYRGLYYHHPFCIPESIDKIGGALLCVLPVWLLRRTGLLGISDELGLSAQVLPAIGFALAVSSPMLIGFAITRNLTPHIEFMPLFFKTFFSPVIEEIEYRGFGVRQLQRGTGWPFWLVVWPSAVLFGLGHAEQGQNIQQMVGLLLLLGLGGLIFAWLVYRWQNLWVGIALHICMNLWWDLFSVGRSAIGGWLPFVLQTMTILLAIFATLYWTRIRTNSSILQRNMPAN